MKEWFKHNWIRVLVFSTILVVAGFVMAMLLGIHYSVSTIGGDTMGISFVSILQDKGQFSSYYMLSWVGFALSIGAVLFSISVFFVKTKESFALYGTLSVLLSLVGMIIALAGYVEGYNFFFRWITAMWGKNKVYYDDQWITRWIYGTWRLGVSATLGAVGLAADTTLLVLPFIPKIKKIIEKQFVAKQKEAKAQ